MFIYRYSEKYRRPQIIKDTMEIIASKVLHLQQGQIETEYFDVTDNIDKERDIRGKLNSNSNLTEDTQSLEQRQKLVKIEKEMVTAVHQLHQEFLKITQIRRREEGAYCSTTQSVQPTSEDLISNEVNSSDTSNPAPASVHGHNNFVAEVRHNNDYLAPFLMSGLFAKDPDNISAEEATRIRESCIATMKERLLERTNIINERLLEESKRLDIYREHGKADGHSQEEYAATCDSLSFKIKILEKRLESQEGRSLHKISELKNKLANDKRLQNTINDYTFNTNK